MARSVCIFCGSSQGSREVYATAAISLARHLAANDVSIVYGGGKVGLMGVIADTALAAGGRVTGVIPRTLVEKEIAHQGLSDLRVVGSMHERKALMADLSDAFIALPGGYGTFEEFCEVLTWTQLGLQRKPCGLLNVDGYYDCLLGLFDRAVSEQFLKQVHRDLVISDSVPEALVRRVLACQVPLVEKWINRQQA
ncbi:MAG: TIGR00730 family Rossman fold protein [Acidobacteriaceae bacterium]|nr:TIGR00730 family Rossman fold protein [Acidobacteriaceae bacterium]